MAGIQSSPTLSLVIPYGPGRVLGSFVLGPFLTDLLRTNQCPMRIMWRNKINQISPFIMRIGSLPQTEMSSVCTNSHVSSKKPMKTTSWSILENNESWANTVPTASSEYFHVGLNSGGVFPPTLLSVVDWPNLWRLLGLHGGYHHLGDVLNLGVSWCFCVI